MELENVLINKCIGFFNAFIINNQNNNYSFDFLNQDGKRSKNNIKGLSIAKPN